MKMWKFIQFIWGVINKIPGWLRYIKVPHCSRDYKAVVSCFPCNNHSFMGWPVKAFTKVDVWSSFSHSPFFFTATLQWMVTRLKWQQNECTKIVPKNHLNSTPWCKPRWASCSAPVFQVDGKTKGERRWKPIFSLSLDWTAINNYHDAWPIQKMPDPSQIYSSKNMLSVPLLP